MKPGWWILAVPVGAVAAAELAGDRLFGVREVRPPAPPTPALVGTFDPTPDRGPDAALVGLFLDGLARAVRDGRAGDAAARFDPVRLHAAVTRTDTFRATGLTPDPVGGAVRARVAVSELVRGPWLVADSIEVRHVVPTDVPGEVVVSARHRRDRVGTSVRWWLAKTGDGWKVFDLEDAATGARLSRQAAAGYAGPISDAVKAGLAAVGPAAAKLADGDAAAADAALAPARAVVLPADGFAQRCLVEGGIAALRGRATEAREWADRAESVKPGLPATNYLRAAAAAAVGEWEPAATAARAYLAAVGPDAAAARILGTALRELGKPVEAAAAFELGLRDDPARDDLRAALADVRGQ